MPNIEIRNCGTRPEEQLPAAPATSERLARLRRVFFPYADRRTAAVQANGGRFAYYTTASVAVSVLRSKEIWMRNAVTMNDFMEISHGFECLNAAYKGDSGAALKPQSSPPIQAYG